MSTATSEARNPANARLGFVRRDILNLRVGVPTLNGLLQGAPSHLGRDVRTSGKADVARFAEEMRPLVQPAGLVWLEDSRVI